MRYKKNNTISRLWAPLLLSLTLFLQGCPMLIIPIIAAYSDSGITVTVEIPKSAPEVFAAAKKRVDSGVSESGIAFTVIDIDEDNYLIKVEGTETEWEAKFAVIPVSKDASQIIATGTDKDRSHEESENLVLQGVKNLCDDLGVRYKVITND